MMPMRSGSFCCLCPLDQHDDVTQGLDLSELGFVTRAIHRDLGRE